MVKYRHVFSIKKLGFCEVILAMTLGVKCQEQEDIGYQNEESLQGLHCFCSPCATNYSNGVGIKFCYYLCPLSSMSKLMMILDSENLMMTMMLRIEESVDFTADTHKS